MGLMRMTPLRASETTIDPFASTAIPERATSLFPSDTFVTAPLVGAKRSTCGG
jgi:hypothetical protein